MKIPESLAKKPVFRQLKQVDEQQHEYWRAQELSRMFEYSEYRDIKTRHCTGYKRLRQS